MALNWVALLLVIAPLWGQEEPSSVENLPMDRFDQYLPNTTPSLPWKILGRFTGDVAISLEASAESPFIGNKVTGKGLILSDNNPSAGEDCGIRYDFTPPPSGRLYLGFDFFYEGTLDFSCELVDLTGRGLHLDLGKSNALAIRQAVAPVVATPSLMERLKSWTGKSSTNLPTPDSQTLGTLEAGKWYHATLEISATNEIVVTLCTTQDKKNPARFVTALLFKPNMRPVFRSLRFFSDAANVQTGFWRLDNVCMAGEVDAPRSDWRPFRQLSQEDLQRSAKKVYAYYYEIYDTGYSDTDPGLQWYTRMIFNPDLAPKGRQQSGTELLYRPLPRPRMESGLSKEEILIRAMEEEVRLARQMGLDGFLLDFFSEPRPHGGQVVFNQRSFALMEAARRVDPNFKIIPAIYSTTPDSVPAELKNKPEGHDMDQNYADTEVVRRALTHPSALRLDDGRVVFSMWGTERHTPGWWAKVLDKLKQNEIPAAFVGQFNGCSNELLTAFSPVCHGMSDWGPRSVMNYHWVPKVRDLTKLVISPVAFQDVRTRENCFWESNNSYAFRLMWKTAIDDQSDWVFITTWSDYSEQAQAPSTSIGFAPYDLNAYYIQWFKTGKQPEIVQDVLYYVYRIQHTDAEVGRGVKWRMIKEGTMVTQPCNEIEMLAFLKAPAELQIKVGESVHTQKAASGIVSFKVPLPLGVALPPPTFSIIRDKQVVVSGQGRYAILDKMEYPDLLYHSGVIAGHDN